MKQIRLSLLIVPLLAVAVCDAQPLPRGPGDTPSHRVLPRQGSDPLPKFRDVAPEELIQFWQRLEAAQGRQGPNRSVHYRTIDSAEALPGDTGDLVKRISESVGRSMVEAINTDISEFAEEANRRFLEQSQRDSGGAANQPDIAFNLDADLDRNLQKTLRELQSYQKDLQQAIQAYQKSWPSESVPPREWIRKVQPFINQELVRQLKDAVQELEKQESSPRSPLGPRPSERQGLGTSSVPKSESRVHSNPVVGSMLKALDARGTNLIKSATARKPTGRHRWWKSLQARSRNKFRALNRRFTENSRFVSQRRNYQLQAIPWTSPRDSFAISAPVFVGASAVGMALVLVWFLRPFWMPARTRVVAEESPLDPQTIRDGGTLLHAFHVVGWQLFGLPSRFWNHRRFFKELRRSTNLDPPSVELLTRIYERARYAAQGAPTDDDLFRARQLFATIIHRSTVSQ